MTRKINTILVDDDEEYLASMKALLESEGFEASPFNSFKKMNNQLHNLEPDILILDINLPNESAFDFIPLLREKTSAGLIMVSGNRSLEYRVKALEKGADAYLIKPIDIRELKAHINSLFQRLNPQKSTVWRLNQKSWRLHSPSGAEHKLTASEFNFLRKFIGADGEIIKKESFLSTAGKADTLHDEGSFHVMLSRLRKKSSNTNHPLPIRAVRNLGYCFYEELVAIQK
ncbi:MAG: response regulator transcription factor [Amphritea sp.]|nr:response regulator transcription factor [Amphritea sp.]